MSDLKWTVTRAAVVLGVSAGLVLAFSTMAAEEQTAATEGPYAVLDVERLGVEDGLAEHYVAAIDEDLFIGVVVADAGVGSAETRTVTAYLCDSQEVSQWISGEIEGQQGTLIAAESSADVTVADGSVWGTLILDGGETRLFTAESAHDDAGVYHAEFSQGGVDHRLGWVVLNDGRQRGPLDGKGNDVPIFATPSPN
jgi:hypothetical protein